jgi:hypothetical protein
LLDAMNRDVESDVEITRLDITDLGVEVLASVT